MVERKHRGSLWRKPERFSAGEGAVNWRARCPPLFIRHTSFAGVRLDTVAPTLPDHDARDILPVHSQYGESVAAFDDARRVMSCSTRRA